MASITTAILIKPELRPCLVNGKQALFHTWVHYTDYINDKEIKTTAGLVETENGQVINVNPTSIQFTDNKIQEYLIELPAGSSPEEV